LKKKKQKKKKKKEKRKKKKEKRKKKKNLITIDLDVIFFSSFSSLLCFAFDSQSVNAILVCKSSLSCS